MADWPRLAQTTIKDYGRNYEKTLMRNQAIMALLQDAGRISFNRGGNGFTWNVQKKRAIPVGNRGDKPLVFVPVNRFEQAFLDYRGFCITDVMTKLEYLKNRGREALINYYAEMGKLLYEDQGRNFQQQAWNNGNAASAPDSFHGLESFTFYNGNSINITTGAIRAFNAGDVAMAPSTTYGGLDTDLGIYGGSVTGVWPNNFVATNQGDTYDFYSPILINYNSTYFGGAVADWAHQCEMALRFGISASMKDASKEGILDVILMNPDLWRQLKDYYSPAQRINIENTKLRKLGFTDTITIDGVECKAEFGVPVGTAYGFNIDQMEFRSMQKTLMATEGPEYHQESQTYRVNNSLLGNFRFTSPKYFAKWFNYTATPS